MRLLCCVAYKGTNYEGWQKQKNAPSVQETIEKVLSQILNQEINIYASGRTDAEVHALRQYFHFDVETNMDLGRMRYSANSLLPKDVFINEIKQVNDDFHARFSAKSKVYTYVIRFGERNPFHFDEEANIPNETDVNLLEEALKQFKGEHNFQDFTSKEEDDRGFVREIYSVETSYDVKTSIFKVTFIGNGFMRYQIRNMVGASLAVASKKEEPDYIQYHLTDNKERQVVAYKAPGQGLFLVDVNY